VRVLALARIEIEVEARDRASGLAVEDVEITHVFVPRRDLPLGELHAVELLRDEQRPGDRRVDGKILAQRLLVDGVARAADALGVVAHVPTIERGLGERLARVLRLLRAKLRDLAFLELGDRALHVTQEFVHGLRIADHLAAKRVVGERAEPVEAGELLAQLEDFVEAVEVLLAAFVVLRDEVALARLLVLRVLHEREVRRVVEADPVIAGGVAVLLLRLEPAFRHALDFGRGER
jgi:hypothetical protein